MKDWQRSPEPPSMMGPPLSSSASNDWPIMSSTPKDLTGTTSTSFTPPETPTACQQPITSTTHIRSRTKVDTTLAEMTKKVILQKIHLFDTFGKTPFPIVRPILEQCSAKKLWALEEESPHLMQHTGYIWKRLCIKEFRDITHAYNSGTLEEVKNWRSFFEIKQNAQQEVLEAAAARVKEKYASLEADRVAHRMKVVAGAPVNRSSRPFKVKGGIGSSSGASNLTAGQKLLSKARKQGNARMQMTTGIRKAAAAAAASLPSPTSPVIKRPRIDEPASPPSMGVGVMSPTRLQSTTNMHQSPPSRPSSIFVTKRRIMTGGPSNTNRY